jgi:hypothetical protein
VSAERIAACELACEPHGGIRWVIAEDAATYDCICVDLELAELGRRVW